MIFGNDPLVIFTFNVPFLGIPFLAVPIPLNEDLTGLVEKKVDTGLTIATEIIGTKFQQKSYSDSISVEFAAKKDSIFSNVVVPLLKKIFSSANGKSPTSAAEVISSFLGGFNPSNSYSISYFSGNQYVIGGILTAFDYGNQDNTDLINVSMTISAPPVDAGSISGEALPRVGTEIVNHASGATEAVATVTKPVGVAPAITATVPTPGSIVPYPTTPNGNVTV